MTKDFLGAYVAFFIVIKRLLFTGIAKRVAENGVNSNIQSTVRILSKSFACSIDHIVVS